MAPSHAAYVATLNELARLYQSVGAYGEAEPLLILLLQETIELAANERRMLDANFIAFLNTLVGFVAALEPEGRRLSVETRLSVLELPYMLLQVCNYTR